MGYIIIISAVLLCVYVGSCLATYVFIYRQFAGYGMGWVIIE